MQEQLHSQITGILHVHNETNEYVSLYLKIILLISLAIVVPAGDASHHLPTTKESNSIEVAVLTEPVGCPEVGLVMHQDKAGEV